MRKQLATTLLAVAALTSPAALAAAKPASPDHAHFIGKPRPPVEATLRPLAAPAVGVPLEVAVSLRAPAGAERVLVEFAASDGLQLLSDAGPRELVVASNRTATTTVRVRPDSGGQLRLTAVVTAIGARERSSRPVSLGLSVPGAVTVAARKPAPRERDAAGQPVEPMQAVTSVNGRPR